MIPTISGGVQNIDLDQLEPDELVALRDRLLALAPLEEKSRTQTLKEEMAERARARFDASFMLEPTGAVKAAHDRHAQQQSEQDRRKAEAEQLGRYYAEAYRNNAGPKRWRVWDRYAGDVAYFALDNPANPTLLQGYQSKEDALWRIQWLSDYFARIGCHIGPKPVEVEQKAHMVDAEQDAAEIPGEQWREIIVAAGEIARVVELDRSRKAVTQPDRAGPRRRAKSVESASELACSVIGDALWQSAEPILPARQPGSNRKANDRNALAGIVLYARGNVGWHRLPDVLGCHPMLCYQRLKEWQNMAIWPRVENLLVKHLRDGGNIDWAKLHRCA